MAIGRLLFKQSIVPQGHVRMQKKDLNTTARSKNMNHICISFYLLFISFRGQWSPGLTRFESMPLS
jgi:hypothetical protein